MHIRYIDLLLNIDKHAFVITISIYFIYYDMLNVKLIILIVAILVVLALVFFFLITSRLPADFIKILMANTLFFKVGKLLVDL